MIFLVHEQCFFSVFGNVLDFRGHLKISRLIRKLARLLLKMAMKNSWKAKLIVQRKLKCRVARDKRSEKRIKMGMKSNPLLNGRSFY